MISLIALGATGSLIINMFSLTAFTGSAFLIHLKEYVICVGVFAAITLALSILYELGLILAHTLMLARPVAYLAYYHVKVLVLGKK